MVLRTSLLLLKHSARRPWFYFVPWVTVDGRSFRLRQHRRQGRVHRTWPRRTVISAPGCMPRPLRFTPYLKCRRRHFRQCKWDLQTYGTTAVCLEYFLTCPIVRSYALTFVAPTVLEFYLRKCAADMQDAPNVL